MIFTLHLVVRSVLFPAATQSFINKLRVVDVYFWFHHGMIDLVYAVWQALDFPNRQQVISGGTLFWNGTDSRRATLNDTIDMDVLRTDKPLQVKDLVSTVDGPFCYLYE